MSPVKTLSPSHGVPSPGALLWCVFFLWSAFLTLAPLQCLTEDKIGVLLHLLEDELDHQTEDRKTTSKLGSDMQVHVTACVLSLCGWACRLVSVA